jgi:hypothetical protein
MNIRPDVITVWPVAFDYPEWRYQISRDRSKFKKVIMALTHNSRQNDFRPFLMDNYKDFTFVDLEPFINKDKWYHYAINEALNASNGEWVLFLEQDFWYSDTFMERFLSLCDNYDYCFLEADARPHLACFAVKRHLIEQTIKYFYTLSTKRYLYDCFDLFTTELQALSRNFNTLEGLGFVDGVDYHHMSGLTQNIHVSLNGRAQSITNREKFKAYNYRCMSYKIPQEAKWMEVMRKIDQL